METQAFLQAGLALVAEVVPLLMQVADHFVVALLVALVVAVQTPMVKAVLVLRVKETAEATGSTVAFTAVAVALARLALTGRVRQVVLAALV